MNHVHMKLHFKFWKSIVSSSWYICDSRFHTWIAIMCRNIQVSRKQKVDKQWIWKRITQRKACLWTRNLILNYREFLSVKFLRNVTLNFMGYGNRQMFKKKYMQMVFITNLSKSTEDADVLPLTGDSIINFFNKCSFTFWTFTANSCGRWYFVKALTITDLFSFSAQHSITNLYFVSGIMKWCNYHSFYLVILLWQLKLAYHQAYMTTTKFQGSNLCPMIQV